MKKSYLILLLTFSIIIGITVLLVPTKSNDTYLTITPDQALRFHVVANSDSSEDQKIKLTVRDEILEKFPNQHPDLDTWTTFLCPEFTSLCPKTGQPDFAQITINYIADKWMVESKSLKLYLFSFRNHGDFHEDCVAKMANDLNLLLRPRYLEVIGEFTPRGGIAIYPFVQKSNQLKKFQDLAESRLLNYSPGKYGYRFFK